MRRASRLVVVTALASACSIKGIADGVRPLVSDGGAADGGDADASGAAEAAAPHPVETIATDQGQIGAITTVGGFVVWSAGGRSIRACPVGGCPTPLSVIADLDITGQLATDGDGVVYTTGRTSNQGVNRCAVPRCEDDRNLGYDLGAPRALAADQGDVFTLETGGRRVITCAAGRCPEVVAANARVDGAIALGLTRVYWSSIEPPPGAIYSCPRSGCTGTPAVFAGSQSGPRALVTTTSDVFWTAYEGGFVLSCPLAGCNDGQPTIVARDQKNPLGLVTDGIQVYWANEGSGTIASCGVRGCPSGPTTLAVGLDRPRWLALDSLNVYIATATTIAKVVR